MTAVLAVCAVIVSAGLVLAAMVRLEARMDRAESDMDDLESYSDDVMRLLSDDEHQT